MARYGGRLEADFHRFYGLDILDLLRAYKWRKIVNLARRLPRHAHTQVAINNDDDLVFPLLDEMSENGELEKAGKARPPAEDYTTEAQKIDQLTRSVDALYTLVDKLLTGGKNPLPQLPTPETARERWERQRAESKRGQLENEIMQAQQRYSQKHKN